MRFPVYNKAMARWNGYEKKKMCIALFNDILSDSGSDPKDHDVDYKGGWFYHNSLRGFRRPDITKFADCLLREGQRAVYHMIWRSYFIPRVNDSKLWYNILERKQS